MQLTRLAVYRPVIVLAVSLCLVMFGVVSYFGLGLEQNPELKLPIVTVQVAAPGVSARTVEERITRRIEEAMTDLGNVKTITSTSQTGLATVAVEFVEGVNQDLAANDVQRRVSAIRRDLPVEAEEPSFAKLDPNDSPILHLAIVGDERANDVEMYRLADEVVRPRLERVPGVGRVELVGGRKPEVQVEVQPDRLRRHDLSIGDVANAVRAQFLSVSGGFVKSGADHATRQVGLRLDSRGRDLRSLEALPLTAGGVRLRDVADVSSGGKEREETVWSDGRPAVGLVVYKQAGANIAAAVDQVLPAVERMNAQLSAGYQLRVIVDWSISVRQSVRGVQEELLIAAGITGLVLFLFLHDFRSALIVLLSIPMSLLVATIALRLTGLTLNMMTLLGMVTAVGVLVDDSIVILENIASHLKLGREPKEAAVAARSEIGLAAIAVTMVDVAVWGPIIFITGIAGAFLRSFAIVLVAATLASLLVSFTLTPLFASRWIPRQDPSSLVARVSLLWRPLYYVCERAYRALLHWSLRHRPVILLVSVLVFGANVFILPLIGTELVPESDRDTIAVVGELPAGTALDASERVARRWESAIHERQRFPEVRSTYLVAGRSDADRDPRFIYIALGLSLPHERTRTSRELGQAVVQVGEQLVPEMRARLAGGRLVQGYNRGQTVQVRIFSEDLGQLTQLASSAHLALARLPDLAEVTNSMVAAPERVLVPDMERLTDQDVRADVIGSTVRIAYQGLVVGQWLEPGGKERDVRVRLPEHLRRDPEAVATQPLVRRGDQMLSIRQVVTEYTEDQPVTISRFNRQRMTQIGAEPNGAPLGSVARSVSTAMDALDLPPGAHWEFAGQIKEQHEAFRQLSTGLVISVVLMYLVLAILYESWVYPVLILTALPLATVGAFLGLLLFEQTLSVPAFIGLIALFGLVGKNSILLIDRTNELRQHGVDRTAALEHAGASRFRPIVMTSAVLVFSMLPVAMKLGEGGAVRAPVGAILVGGMSTSTVLSLLFVPVAYTYFDSFQTLIGRLFRWRPRRIGSADDGRRRLPFAEPAGLAVGDGALGRVPQAD